MNEYVTYKGLIARGWSKKLISEYLANLAENKSDFLKDRIWLVPVVTDMEQLPDVASALLDVAARREELRPFTQEQKEMIEHNEQIISENLDYGEKEILRGVCAAEEVEAYEQEAAAEQRSFKKFLRSGGIPVFDTENELWKAP